MDLSPGQQIGAYRIVRLLGKGGMGAVYEVEHVQLGVHYALKAFTLEGLSPKFCGEELTTAADAYRTFLLELARDEKDERALLALLDDADVKLNVAFEQAKGMEQ